MKNYYDILGISQSATSEEIRKAYRKLSLKFHPDQNGNDTYFSEMFKSINEAHLILTDPVRKETYDHQLISRNSVALKFASDELIESACLVVSHNSASSSLIQRKMKVGITKAFHLLDELESLGVISKFDENNRKVLVNEDGLRNILLTKLAGVDISKINQLLSVNKQKVQNITTSSNKITYSDVWSSVRTWKRIKWTLFFIDLILVFILLLPDDSDRYKKQQTTPISYEWVTTEFSVVYSKPDINSSIIGNVSSGKSFNSLKETNFFIKITFIDGNGNDKEGYIQKKHMKKIDE